MKRLLVDLKENCHGEITGRIDLPADSVFALECVAELVSQLSKNCGVPAVEILQDLINLTK